MSKWNTATQVQMEHRTGDHTCPNGTQKRYPHMSKWNTEKVTTHVQMEHRKGDHTCPNDTNMYNKCFTYLAGFLVLPWGLAFVKHLVVVGRKIIDVTVLRGVGKGVDASKAFAGHCIPVQAPFARFPIGPVDVHRPGHALYHGGVGDVLSQCAPCPINGVLVVFHFGS